jgi:hypothetical protein
MKLRFRESKYGVPAGIYKARFVNVKENQHEEYGPGLEWQFEVIEGAFAGKLSSRTTAPEPTLKNSCGRMLQALSRGKYVPGQEVDIDPFVGQAFQIVVEQNSSGSGTRVGSVLPLPELEYGQADENGEAKDPKEPIPF